MGGRWKFVRPQPLAPLPPPLSPHPSVIQVEVGQGEAEVPDPAWTGGRKMVPPSPTAVCVPPPPREHPGGGGCINLRCKPNLIPPDRREGLRSPAEAAAGPARGRGAAVLPPLPPGGPPGRSGHPRCASRCRVMVDRTFIKVFQESMLWLIFF